MPPKNHIIISKTNQGKDSFMFALRFLKKNKFDNYADYIENGQPIVPENFNFAYDVIDVIARETPDKPAILWTNDNGERKTFSFRDLSELSNAAANFLLSRGIKRGDAVLLFLRRRWEYWVLMMAMHKLGVIPIPSTNQLKAHDIEYRIKTADVKNIIAFDDGYIMDEIKKSIGDQNIQLISNVDVANALDHMPRTLDRVATNNHDTMVLYFTSGTTGIGLGKMFVGQNVRPMAGGGDRLYL